MVAGHDETQAKALPPRLGSHPTNEQQAASISYHLPFVGLTPIQGTIFCMEITIYNYFTLLYVDNVPYNINQHNLDVGLGSTKGFLENSLKICWKKHIGHILQ